MYTELKSYQIIIALLKEYGIRNCVISAGSRNVPFAHGLCIDKGRTGMGQREFRLCQHR